MNLGSNTNGAAQKWIENSMKPKYVRRNKDNAVKAVTFFYDPELKIDVSFNSAVGLMNAWYMVPQDPKLAHDMYEGVKVEFPGYFNGTAKLLPGFALNIIALLMAQEFGDDEAAMVLRRRIEQIAEPRYFGDGEFGYFFNFKELWPRGQISALLVCAEVLGKGQWQSVFNKTPEQHAARLSEPTVEGVDFPSLGISKAKNDLSEGVLHIETYAATPSQAKRKTTFRIVNLPTRSAVSVSCDGSPHPDWRSLGDRSIEITTDIGDHAFVVHTGVLKSRL